MNLDVSDQYELHQEVMNGIPVTTWQELSENAWLFYNPMVTTVSPSPVNYGLALYELRQHKWANITYGCTAPSYPFQDDN